MARPVGSDVGLFMDMRERLHPGDALVAATTGRCYLVRTVREQARGLHIGRQHLRAVVFASIDDLPADPDRAVLPFAWYPRPRRTYRGPN